jgi:nucleosome binding factor SPN SPT16 subunit
MYRNCGDYGFHMAGSFCSNDDVHNACLTYDANDDHNEDAALDEGEDGDVDDDLLYRNETNHCCLNEDGEDVEGEDEVDLVLIHRNILDHN